MERKLKFRTERGPGLLDLLFSYAKPYKDTDVRFVLANEEGRISGWVTGLKQVKDFHEVQLRVREGMLPKSHQYITGGKVSISHEIDSRRGILSGTVRTKHRPGI